jgi:HTH-type transcriptional regulator, quorum sensing regulator NprR
MCETLLIRQSSIHPRGRHTGVEAEPELIRRAREEAGLSQAQLGEPLLTRQAVHAIESGRVRPSPRSLGHIAGRLGLPVEAFLREGGPSADSRASELRRLCEAQSYREVVERAEVLLRAPEPSAVLLAAAHHYAGVALYHMERPSEAIAHLEQARHHAADVPDGAMVAESLDWEAAAWHLLDDPRALDVARDALARYRRLPGRKTGVEVRMLWRVASALSRRGAYEEAERCYDEALHVRRVGDDVGSVAKEYHSLAGRSRDAGDAHHALELMRKAVAFYMVNLELRGGQFDAPLISGMNDLAMALIEVDHLDEADGTLNTTLARLEESGGQTDQLVPYVLHTRSLLRQKQRRLGEAIRDAEETIERSERLGLPRMRAAGLKQLGGLYEDGGHPRLADRSYRQAIEVLHNAEEFDKEREVASAYRRLRQARRTRRARTA